MTPSSCSLRTRPWHVDGAIPTASASALFGIRASRCRRILILLHRDARMPNSALADAVGIAPSTCHGRVRRLHELGVIRGFYADIDPAAIGLSLQAMISVSLQ